MTDNGRTTVRMFDIDFDAMTFSQAIAAVTHAARSRQTPIPYVVTPNVDHIVRLSHQPELKPIYDQATFRFVDGFPVEMFARLTGKPVPERITGADLLPKLCQEAAKNNLKVFMLGGPPGSAEMAGKILQDKYGKFDFGSYCPPLAFEHNNVENYKILVLINQFDPDLLFVGVGSPKQECWIHRWRGEIKAGIALGIGAAIEFAAGTTERAPRMIRSIGMEWFWRMAHEPKRLGLRYLKDFEFFFLAWQEYRFSGATRLITNFNKLLKKIKDRIP